MHTRKVGRNDPCPCGSGKKYKHCCLRKDRQRGRARTGVAVPRQETGTGQPLAEIRRMAQAAMPRALPDEAQKLQRLLDLAEEVAAYEAMSEEIEEAAQILEAHRAEFEALLSDVTAVQDRTQRLFSEERFLPYRFSASDVHRAFEAVGYPRRYREDPEKGIETLIAAILYLADENRRPHLARQLMMQLPEYVSAGRYLDAWLIQYSAFRMIEAPETSNAFLFEMFEHGFAEWTQQVEAQQERLMDELGIDPSAVAGKTIDQVEAWIEAQMADPAKKARLEAFYAEHLLMSDQAQAEMRELERDMLLLLERDDADRLYLSPQEMAPWMPTLLQRLAPLKESALDAAERGEWDDPDILQGMQEVMVELAQEMAGAVFTSERRERLAADLRDYRRQLVAAQESEAAMYAHTAFTLLEGEDSPAENRFLVALCFASLRATLITLSEEGPAS